MENLIEVVENNQTEMIELRLHGDQSSEDSQSYLVCAELRVTPAEIELNGGLYTCGLRKAYVFTKLSGCTMARGSRLNDSLPSDTTVVDTNTERRTKIQKTGVDGDASVGPTGIVGAIKVASSHLLEKNLTREVVAQRTSVVKNVSCKPNGRWEVNSNNPSDQDSFLDDTFLPNTALFAVTEDAQANRIHIVAELVTRKRDIVVRKEGKRRGLIGSSSPNKEHVLGLVMGNALEKSMINDGVQGNSETLVFARATITDVED